MKRIFYFLIFILLIGCSPVPIHVLQNPPLTEVAPGGYTLYKSYDFTNEVDKPPTSELETMEVWGVDHVSRKDGGMWNPDGTPVPPNDPRNFCEWNPNQVMWVVGGYLNLVTDLNRDPQGTPVVAGLIATKESFLPPVYVAARVRVAPDGGTYWTSFVSYSPSGWLPENDYFEFECSDSRSFTSTIHRAVDPKGKIHQKFRFPVDLSTAFHIYACELWPDKYRIYLDNVLIGEFEAKDLNIEPVYFLIGNAIFQGCDPDLISPENRKKMFPMAATVDYIRIYRP